MAALTKVLRFGLAPSTYGLPSPIWITLGVFGFIAAGLVLIFTDPISDRMVWLAENYRTAGPALSPSQVDEVRRGVHVWAWAGFIVGATAPSYLRAPPRALLVLLSTVVER